METPKFISMDDAANSGIFVLLYGESSSGKTYVSQTFPEPIYVMDTEYRAINTKYECFRNKDIKIHDPSAFVEEASVLHHKGAFNTHETVENMTRFVVWYCSEVKKGNIKGGTLVLDSSSDIWKWVSDWAMYELAKYSSKDGSKKADIILMRLNNQMDWRVANSRYHEIVGVLRKLLPLGINVVLTAREQQVPEYVAKSEKETLKDRISCHKDTPFLADCIFNLRKIENAQTGTVRYVAKVEKSGTKPVTSQYIDNLDYEKIINLLGKEKKVI